jgi:hypothetical protein
MLCAHCQRRPRSRPRGLCWGCYYTPGIRKRYPRINRFAVRGGEDFRGYAYLPIEPTRALPGSPEKVAVLAERARRRVSLWHPADASLDWDVVRPVCGEMTRHPTATAWPATIETRGFKDLYPALREE